MGKSSWNHPRQDRALSFCLGLSPIVTLVRPVRIGGGPKAVALSRGLRGPRRSPSADHGARRSALYSGFCSIDVRTIWRCHRGCQILRSSSLPRSFGCRSQCPSKSYSCPGQSGTRYCSPCEVPCIYNHISDTTVAILAKRTFQSFHMIPTTDSMIAGVDKRRPVSPPMNHGDKEKQVVSPASRPMPTFPEGGLMGWLAVLGSWFASVYICNCCSVSTADLPSVFATFGYSNTFGVFQVSNRCARQR